MSIFRYPHNMPLWSPFRVYPLNFLCSPPALNEHLGLSRSSASSLSQNSLGVGTILYKSMKHIVKILTLVVAISALWIGLLQTSIIPRSHTWLLPIYFIVSLGCYGLLMVGVGLMQFPTCPQEAVLLQQDIAEAKDFLKQKGVDVGGCD
ncbi:dolichol-phosphate mannose synthase subunit 3 [Pyrus x bretschneideri]|uniref:dolichol-phosphate mannose synthase subunit 3 n=1 Tax=Pyrus x bretschneideri TaxID=225117 RepID=UPI00202E4EB8|nr:dolichol-phosphate mannose synthase subunit 3 [Pyrus x bretschneideri]